MFDILSFDVVFYHFRHLEFLTFSPGMRLVTS